jgi:hypothetical protein
MTAMSNTISYPDHRDNNGELKTIELMLTKAERHRLNESLDGRKLENMSAEEQWEVFFSTASQIFG